MSSGAGGAAGGAAAPSGSDSAHAGVGAPGGAPVPVRGRVLGCPVDLVDMAQALERLVSLVDARRRDSTLPPALVVTLNPEMVMRARRDPGFRHLIEDAALVIPDGVGLVMALRRRGHRDAGRVAGVDLLERYAAEAARRGDRLAFTGAAPGVAAAAAAALTERHPGLIVATDSGDPDASTAERLAAARPDVVGAAYGAGRQERFLVEHLAGIGAAVGIGVGGSLDFLAGRIRRAPGPVRRAGLEWAWRLACEPWRVRRQAVLPLFWWLERREAAR